MTGLQGAFCHWWQVQKADSSEHKQNTAPTGAGVVGVMIGGGDGANDMHVCCLRLYGAFTGNCVRPLSGQVCEQH